MTVISTPRMTPTWENDRGLSWDGRRPLPAVCASVGSRPDCCLHRSQLADATHDVVDDVVVAVFVVVDGDVNADMAGYVGMDGWA